MFGDDGASEPEPVAGLNVGTDAIVAIISAAAAEHALTRLLKRRCQYDKKIYDDMFDGVGPFTTFEAKINLAFLLGLLRKTTMQELKLVNRISILFSERPATLTFDAKPVLRLIAVLVRSDTSSPILSRGSEGLSEASGRSHFISTCKRLVGVFSNAAAQTVEPIGPLL